jgi:hypothetical protein
LTTPIVASPSSAAGSGSPPGAGTGADVTGGCSTTVVDGALGRTGVVVGGTVGAGAVDGAAVDGTVLVVTVSTGTNVGS